MNSATTTTGEAASLGAVLEAIRQVQLDVKDIRDTMMPRVETESALAGVSARVTHMESEQRAMIAAEAKNDTLVATLAARVERVEGGPANNRNWLSLWIMGAGCLVSLVVGGLGVLITAVIAIAPHIH